jgi:hypothetical protein
MQIEKKEKEREREQKLASTIWDKVLQGQPTIRSLPLETKHKTLKKYFPSEKKQKQKNRKKYFINNPSHFD